MNDDLRAHLEFFGELGVDGVRLEPEWRTRAERRVAESSPVEPDEPAEPVETDEVKPSVEPVAPAVQPARVFGSQAEALEGLRVEIGPDCRLCKLHMQGRKQIVFGVGNPNADLMFVGEAPGADEDVQGEPFVGRAGQLLTKIIESIGLQRSDVYIANVIKCRPPQNRNPEPDEVASCQPFLFQQIDAIQPRVIVALGTFAAQALLGSVVPISRLRGQLHDFRGGAKLIPTFHPAFLLRSPDRKRDVWEDMKKVRELLARPT